MIQFCSICPPPTAIFAFRLYDPLTAGLWQPKRRPWANSVDDEAACVGYCPIKRRATSDLSPRRVDSVEKVGVMDARADSGHVDAYPACRKLLVHSFGLNLATPRVPGAHSLLEQCDVLVVRHASSSTRLPTARYRLARLLYSLVTTGAVSSALWCRPAISRCPGPSTNSMNVSSSATPTDRRFAHLNFDGHRGPPSDQ